MRRGRVKRTFAALVVVATGMLGMVGVLRAGAAGVAPVTAPVSSGVLGVSGVKASKLSPRLELLARRSSFASGSARAQALSLPSGGVGSLVLRRDGGVVVEIRVRDMSTVAVARLRDAGAQVISASPAYHVITAEVAPTRLAAVSADPAVRYVSEVLAPRHGSPSALGSAGLAPALSGSCAPIVSEGDTAMNVAAARAAYGVDGSGQTVGVLSDSYDVNAAAATHAAGDVAAGELPGPGNPCGHTSPVVVQADASAGGGQDEGRAQAQLVHDLAPGAHLAFATAGNGELDFANQITKLRSVNHATALVDDVGYLDEPFYQDGPIATAVNRASAAGVPYFSAAGNSNVSVGGQNVSSYETPAYRPTACPVSVVAAEAPHSCHNFDPTGGTDNGDAFTLAPGGGLTLDLQWAQPWGVVTTDFDVFLVDSSGAIVAGSAVDNQALEEPVEVVGYQNTTGTDQTVRLVVAMYNADGQNARFKFVIADASGITGVQYNASNHGDVIGSALFGHAGTDGVASVAAIPYDDATTPEPFSAHGTQTRYFTPTPSVMSLVTPDVVDKPDFAASDGVQTSFFAQQVAGVYRFYGTSAAAPQAAAIAALLLAEKPTLTTAEVRALMAESARPVPNGGTPDAVGAGYLDANAALAAVAALPNTPSAVSAVAGDGMATVQWQAPSAGYGTGLTGYALAVYKSGALVQTQIVANTTTTVVTGLTNGATYTFRVFPTDASSTGPESLPSSAVTVGTPTAPVGFVASSSSGGAVLHWTVPNANGSPISRYVLNITAGGVLQYSGYAQLVGSGAIVNGLTNGTIYVIHLAAQNARGVGADAISAPVMPGLAPLQPTAPTAVSANAAAVLSWTAPNAETAPITGYQINANIGATKVLTRNVGPAVAYTFTGLTNGTTYRFTVAATSAVGTGQASPFSILVTVGAPRAPTALVASTGNGRATLQWTAPLANGAAITKYVVTPYVGATAQAPRTFASTATTQIVAGLTNGTAYGFKVAAVNSRGTGAQSNATPAMVIGTPGVPTSITATAGHQKATVHWTAPPNNGATITGYIVTPYIGAVAQTPIVFNTTATTDTVTGLTTTKQYTFRVSAKNSRGAGARSTASNVVKIT
ncbi:MAG: Alkaline phosphatase [Actinomycetia bacterium]|jgi:fibronectin type 3 domain-containing protein|nr:Alkaline phosphatase [Actinomycetes bacterium]